MNQSRPANPPLSCPVCNERLPTGTLETHLRQQHRIYQFRGQRRSLEETLDVLAEALCGRQADRQAWIMLSAIAREQHGPGADAFLVKALSTALGRREGRRRDVAITCAALTILDSSDSTGLLSCLTTNSEPIARHLALALVARWPTPLADDLLPLLLPLLHDALLPEELQIAAAATLLRSGRKGQDRDHRVLQALIENHDRSQSVARLRRLQQQVGVRPSLDSLCRRLEATIPMRCPQCDIPLHRPELVQHLWEEHGLVLEGNQVREPWLMMKEWLTGAHGAARPPILARCRELAQRLDPDNGLTRVHRLILSTGMADPEAQRHLLTGAREGRASLCSTCFARVPIPRPVVGKTLNCWQGRLSGKGYLLEISESGFLTHLEIATPQGIVYRDKEPGRSLTFRGALLLLVGPLIALALALAVGLVGPDRQPLMDVGVILLVAMLAGVLVRRRWRVQTPLLNHAVDLAWLVLAPRLHAHGFSETDSEFLASLALTSVEHGRPAVRSTVLTTAFNFTGKALTAHPQAVGHLAALRRLAIEDAAWEAEDPVPLVVAEVAHCLEGKLPLAYAEALLADWKTSWWTRGNLARLKVLLCDRAFEAGFEVRHLIDLGHLHPALGAVIEAEDPRGLIHLRLLWSMRPSRPWDRVGEAATVFEVALDPESADLLAAYPDLLLYQEDLQYAVALVGGEGPGPLRILLCGKGVVVQEALFEEIPTEIGVVARLLTFKGSHELLLGDRRFRFSSDPGAVAERLERWFRFLFHEFLRQTAGVLDWPSPDLGAVLRARGAVPCPECGRPLIPRVGRVAESPHD